MKTKLSVMTVEFTARKRAIDRNGVDQSGEWLGYAENEQRLKPWVLYNPNGQRLDAFSHPYWAAHFLARLVGLRVKQLERRDVQFTVYAGRTIIGWIDEGHPGEWTAIPANNFFDDDELHSRAGAIRALLRIWGVTNEPGKETVEDADRHRAR